MKKPLHLLLGAGFAIVVLSSYANGPYAGGAGNRTGSAGTTANCTGGGCHAANNSALVLSVVMLDNGTQVTKYQVGKTYRILFSGTVPSTTRPKFGFQVSCVKAANTSQQAGTLSTGGRANTAMRTTSSPNLIEHTTPLAGTIVGGTMVDTVSFLWTPGASLGTVRFYAIMNAVNNDNSSNGDMPNATTADFTEATTGIAGISQNLSGIYPNPASNELFVPLKAGTSDITVFDATGRKMQGLRFEGANAREVSLNVSNLPAGQYFLQVIQDGALQSTSFIKH